METFNPPISEEARAILNGKLKPLIPDAELLERTEQYIRRYVVLSESAYLPAALWAIATHAVQRFETFPYIAAVSAVKRSGKTRLAEVFETLARDPWRGTAPSSGSLPGPSRSTWRLSSNASATWSSARSKRISTTTRPQAPS